MTQNILEPTEVLVANDLAHYLVQVDTNSDANFDERNVVTAFEFHAELEKLLAISIWTPSQHTYSSNE